MTLSGLLLLKYVKEIGPQSGRLSLRARQLLVTDRKLRVQTFSSVFSVCLRSGSGSKRAPRHGGRIVPTTPGPYLDFSINLGRCFCP